MPHTITDLKNLINSVLDHEQTCRELPNVCSLLDSEQGRLRVVAEVERKILKEGIESIDAALLLIEDAMDEKGD